MDLVIVESPAKAKTINKYLGEDKAIVLASFGHVRDLPERNGSVDPDNDFAMSWEERNDLKQITNAAKNADRVVLATDPDREGEAISWHVLEVLNRKKLLNGKDVCRVVFNAITKNAVLEAMAQPREIDQKLVDAYRARRALDYLVGFNLSPVLWRKLPGARSAGRVQSVALRLICQREIEIEQFKPREYWSVDSLFAASAGKFTARLSVWQSKKANRFTIENESAAREAEAIIKKSAFAVEKVESKPEQRNPSPPFTTSTLQQEASRKLNFTANQTMRVAQKLYEDGLITYMRTDGIDIAPEAIADIRGAIERDFGGNFVPPTPRQYKKKSLNAQEAHEAVRPTQPSLSPPEAARQTDENGAKLYELIWKRTIASQMKNAEVQRTTITILSDDKQTGFRATGTVITFAGFLELYKEDEDDKNDDSDDKELTLPKVTENEPLTVEKISPEQHFTSPPPRYNEASLVKKMEELGIGRPSTYASILSVLRERDYVRMEGKRFVPEDKGRLVVAFLESFFTRYVEYDFTAELENELDKVAEGNLDYKDVLTQFWGAFYGSVESTLEYSNTDILNRMNEVLGEYIFRDRGDGSDPRSCPQCDEGELSLKTGRYGAFVGCTRYPDCSYTRPFAGEEGDGTDIERILGVDPETGQEVHVKQGRFGPYIQLGEMIKGEEKPKRAAIPKSKNPAAIELDYALQLLALPRLVGTHPETGEEIRADIGRYGPYLRSGSSTASLENVDEVFDIGVNRAVTVLANKPKRGRGTSNAALAELGAHPEDGKPVRVLNGRFGPYVKHDKINASVPRDEDPATLTIDRALELLAARIAKGGKKRASAKKKPTTKKKTTAKKKPAAKKSVAKE